ncbi:helix-turn-helix domain-containing protein, partial [Burkholderia sp. Bp9143]|uniref:helix-turn-helix domain-containing protein n=1 Tax=Burkholderia sp. Bp9143 TaxID=2184574 RepID=UPI000F58FB04
MAINAIRIVWQHFPRGGSEMLVMLALADWCNDDGKSLYPSMNAIAKKCRLSKAQARRIVRRFIAEGLVEVLANAAGGNPGQTPHYWLESVKQHGRSATTILAGQRGSCRWVS